MVFILLIATIILVAWVMLMSMVTREDWILAAYNKVLDNLTKIDELRAKDAARNEKISGYRGLELTLMKIFLGGDSEKKIEKLNEENTLLQAGNLSKVSIPDMPGYVLLRKTEALAKSGMHKKIYQQCVELYGRKHAGKKAKQLWAKMLSYPIIGIAAVLYIGAVIMTVGDIFFGSMILAVGTAIVLAFSYSVYDELRAKVAKRRNAMIRQFPNVVSKLALLTTSGMIMDRAWKETAFSREEELYKEMQTTSEELDNLVSPDAAYSAFITRCNTKETAKLASAIMQNLSKGNAEIGRLLKDMAKEAWLERRHIAKRDAEKANSKLLIPTMLLFAVVLLMILVPIAMNFGGL